MVPRDVMGNMSINIDGEFYAIIVGRLAVRQSLFVYTFCIRRVS